MNLWAWWREERKGEDIKQEEQTRPDESRREQGRDQTDQTRGDGRRRERMSLR